MPTAKKTTVSKTKPKASVATTAPEPLIKNGLFTDEARAVRCAWCRATPFYQHYHDHEWGFPVDDENRLFEKLCLEGFQSGLSWLTILNKREAFRAAFAGFDAEKIAKFGEKDIARLLADAGIVRHRGKIESTINNARRVLELRKEFGSLARYVWQFEPPAADRPARLTHEAAKAMTTSAASIALSKDLKKRGWSFVGPTTMYAFIQAMGLVNDHLEGCGAREAALAARARFKPPKA
jgi:DNA-3-methyladenine glycosylase I